MTPDREYPPAAAGEGPLAVVLRAVRSGSVGISRIIWRVLSTIHEERETRTRTGDGHLARTATAGGPAPPAPG